MSDLDSKLKDICKDLAGIKKSVGFGEKKKKIKELEVRSANPDFWKDKEIAKDAMRQMGDLKNQVEMIEKAEDLLQEIRAADELGLKGELVKNKKEILKVINRLKLSTYLSGEHDRKAAIVTIHAGQGGVEAMDWASMLYRMYLRYCERRNWKTEIISESEGEEAGMKSVTFEVVGDCAYGYLKGEAGTHRLVRQSPFNADRKRETSFALVEVLPELKEVDMPDINLNDDDLEWQFFRASTQGGQNVQKVSTAVRVKHKPSGLTVTSQTQRKQIQNRKIALDLLRSKLWLREQVKTEEEKKKLKGEYRPASWGNQIRSYVLHPYKMVKDLRTEVETSDADSVLDGDLDDFVQAELKLSLKILA